MARARTKIKILGYRNLLSIFKEVVANKLLGSLSNVYKRRSKIIDTFIDKGADEIRFENDIWKVKLKIDDEIFNLSLRDNTSDMQVFTQIFEKKEYRDFFEVASKKLINPKKMIDLGGNIGLTTVYSKLFFKSMKVVIVEPSSENCQILLSNLKNNDISAEVLENAIWNSKTNLSLVKNFRDGLAWSIQVKEDADGKIKAIDLHDLYSEGNIDLLKMDIEGAEFQLFKEDDYASNFLRKTKIIAIEIHEDFGSKSLIVNKLKSMDFTCFDSGELTIGINNNLID